MDAPPDIPEETPPPPMPARTPRCRPEQLGQPIPDDPHAISVCLPTWEDVIDYEEGKARVKEAMRSGYPRFFLPPLVAALPAALGAENALVFASAGAGRRACAHVARCGGSATLEDFLGAAIVRFADADSRVSGALYWRYAGEGISSRAAMALAGGARPVSPLGDAARAEVRQRLARWHGVGPENVFLFPSGMAAVATIHRFLSDTRPGRGCVQVDFPYVDVTRVQRHLGNARATALSGRDAVSGGLADVLGSGQDAGVFCEVPANPMLECADLPVISRICQAAGVPVVADDTVASVANVALLPHADFVTTSLSKWFNGRCNLLAGAVVCRSGSPWAAGFHAWLAGQDADGLADADAIELAVNSRGFAARMEKVNANGALLSSWLREHPMVENVWFPSLEAPHPYAAVARPGAGAGGLISFVLRGGEPAAARFYDAVALDKGPSLGADFSMLCPYTLLAHYDELEHARAWGVPRDLLRLSIGTESPDHLREVVEAALEQAAK